MSGNWDEDERAFMITRRTAAAGLATTLITMAQRGGAQTPAQAEALKGNGFGWTVTARPQLMGLRPGAAEDVELWTFNGELAPVFRMRHGSDLRLALRNETPKPLALHFHGIRGPNAMDGAGGLTQEPVPPGGAFEYGFAPPDPGTFIIRPCILGGSAEPQERGLSAFLIIEEPDPPQVERDVSVLVDDWALADDGSLNLSEPAPAGRLGSWLSVNGKAAPQRIEAPQNGRIRLRLANVCNARAMRLRFDGVKARVIAMDGQSTGTFDPLRATLPFAPGTRYDLLVDLPPEPGRGAVTALIGQGMPLVEIVTTGERRPALPPLDPLPPNRKLPEAIRLQDATRRDVVIAGDAGSTPWTINGTAGDPSRPPLVKVKRGSPMVLTLTNRTPFVQPMHLHGHAFRLLHALDDGWEPYWLDTVQVPEDRTIRIAFVADNPGRWLLASTVLERFDSGLWTWIEVT